jgi:hypothetical protein
MYDDAPEYNPLSSADYCAWWEKPDDDKDELEQRKRADSLIDLVRGLEMSQKTAHEQNLWNARLYSNRELANFDWGHGLYFNQNLAPVSLLGENLVLSVVDTMVSLIGKNHTKVTPVPRGASWRTYLQVRRLDKWLYGEFVRNKVYAKTKRVFRDACIFGFGAVKVDLDEEKKLRIRRVFPDDLIVDQVESINSNDGVVQHVYERRCRRVEDIEAEYGLPEGSVKSHLGQSAVAGYLPYRSPGRGWAIVTEGYRCARGKQMGRHYVATPGYTILDEEWTHEWHPYLWFHINEPVSGFYWPSIVEQVLPYQIRLNEINEVIRDAQDLMARPRILVAEGSRVNPADLDNLVARIIKYTGVKPEALTWEAVSPELYNERDREVRVCFEQFGLGQLVAQGKLPGQARLDSSAALREATSITDDRLADPMQRFEEFHLTLGELMVRTMQAEGEGYETTWYSGGKPARAETIKWSELDLDKNAYVFTLEAASVFSMTPAARRDTLEQWLADGRITPERYAAMSSNPDLEREMSLQAAAEEDITRVIELLEEGKYESPTPIQDLANGVQRISMAYLALGRYEGVPVKTKVNFLKWISMARAVLSQGTQTPQGGVGGVPATGSAPGAQPMMMPPMGGMPPTSGPTGVPAMPQMPMMY